MESNDILNIILLFLGMLIGICLYMFAYSDANKKLAKRIIIVCISTSLIFLLSYYWYLENMVSVEVKSLENKKNEINKGLQDEMDVNKLKDSLLSYKSELEKLKQKLEGYSKIINVSDKQKTLSHKIQSLDVQIERIESYNEVLPRTEFFRKRKGETFSGETSSLILYPPTDFNTQFLDFSLLFVNEKMIKNVACIYVEIFKINQDGSWSQLWDEYYSPRKGYNKLRIRNYLKQKNTEMRIGFFWKSEFGKKEYPRFEYVRFSLNN